MAESINQDLDNMNQALSEMITDMNRSFTSSTYGTRATSTNEDQEVGPDESEEDPVIDTFHINLILNF